MGRILLNKAFLIGIVLYASLGLSVHAETPHAPIKFTDQEASYIQQAGTIKMCVDPDWMPFERIDEHGRHEGIAADLIQLIARRVGLKIEALPVRTWEESLAASHEGRCQIMSFLNQTSERDQWLIFTAPIFSDPNVIITREEHMFVPDLRALSGQSVAVPRGTMVAERIQRDFPNLKLIPTGSEQESVALVSERKADLTVRTLIVAAYSIKKEGLFNLKIAGQVPEYTNQLRIGVLKDQTLLRNILDKGAQTLTAQEREEISNRHVSINVQQGIDYGLLWKVVAVAGCFLLITIYWNRKLRLLNIELERLSITDKLTGLFNRMRLDEALTRELQRAERFKQPFSVILLDIDYFKLVNDTHGHLVGDRLLVEVAKVLQAHTRDTDIVGRWGGEEFMIVCPNTDRLGAVRSAENLREIFQAHCFPVITHKTISLGVTSYCPGDRLESIVGRADAALYEAKNNGRNRVEFR